MSKKYPGFYIYYDWLEAMESLPAYRAMAIIKNLSNYTRSGVEPPPLEGQAGALQTLFASQIKRSKTNAENGSKGGAPTHKSPSASMKNQSIDMSSRDIDDMIFLKKHFSGESHPPEGTGRE